MGKKDFEKLFIEAVDEGLETLGESGKHMIFYHLEKNQSIMKQEIPKKPAAFAAGLETIFGAGASVLEKVIVKSLCLKLGLKYEDRETRPFTECVKCLKEKNVAKDAREANRSSGLSSNQRLPEAKSACAQPFLPYTGTEIGTCTNFHQ